MKIDYETLRKIKENQYYKLKDGYYNGVLFKIDYQEVGEYNIPTVNFHFKINNKKVSKGIFLTNKKGVINNINKLILDRYLSIITGEYYNYKNRNELQKIVDDIEIGEIPITLRLFTKTGNFYQNFEIEFE